MPNRCQSGLYRAYKTGLEQRDGGYCIACFCDYGQKRSEPAVKLQIDHADNNPQNWSWENLHLVCATHNNEFRSLSLKDHVSRMARYSAMNIHARAQAGTEISLPKILVDYMAGSPEMQVNSICEIAWLEFMHKGLEEANIMPKRIAIEGGAQVVGCSTSTIRNNYLAKAVSPYGPFKEDKDSNGHKIIVYREPRVAERGNGHNGHKSNGDRALAGTVKEHSGRVRA